jgi:maleate cis-trans isomerase
VPEVIDSSPIRIGVIVPSMNFVVETELPAFLRSRSDLVIHWSRVGFSPGIVPDDENYIAEFARNLPAALRLLELIPLQDVYFACTSASLRLGETGDAVSRILTAWDCLTWYLKQRQIRKVTLLTPYSEKSKAEMRHSLGLLGIEVEHVESLKYAEHFRDVSYEELREKIESLPADSPIILPCTAVSTYPLYSISSDRILISSIYAMAKRITSRLSTKL